MNAEDKEGAVATHCTPPASTRSAVGGLRLLFVFSRTPYKSCAPFVFSSHWHQKINKASNQATTSYIHDAPPLPVLPLCCSLQTLVQVLQLHDKLAVWLYHREGCSFAISRVKELQERGNWIFDTCHFHSAAPCSLATYKDFSCHSSACYEWAQGLRNPITTTVSDPCQHPYICYSHVPQIRKDVPISSFSSSDQARTSISICVSQIRAAALLMGCLTSVSPADRVALAGGWLMLRTLVLTV